MCVPKTLDVLKVGLGTFSQTRPLIAKAVLPCSRWGRGRRVNVYDNSSSNNDDDTTTHFSSFPVESSAAF